MGEIKFLKERAKEFWEEALELNQKKKYNLTAFNIEQSCQLRLKYLIGKKVGEWSKTHSFQELISEFSKAYNSKEILDFYKEKELFFDDIEDAYFTSRYFPKIFSKDLVSDLIAGASNFFEITEKLTGEKFI